MKRGFISMKDGIDIKVIFDKLNRIKQYYIIPGFKTTKIEGPFGDGCCYQKYEATKFITLQTICEHIITSEDIWGEIEIVSTFKSGSFKVKYSHGQYIDDQNNKIEFELPSDLIDARVDSINLYNGWPRADWYIVYSEKEKDTK